MPDLRKIAEAATQILADVRAGNHPHGDIRDAGRVLTGRWDQDFPTAVLGLGQTVLSLLDQQEQKDATIERMRAALTRLVANKDAFDQSSGNQADAYYCLVKGCDADWKEARAALNPDNASQEMGR